MGGAYIEVTTQINFNEMDSSKLSVEDDRKKANTLSNKTV
jgi:hypothetical protein